MGGLVVVETHPVQYHAPVYRAVQNTFGIPVTVVYGSDFSIAGYRDEEFGVRFSWDTDLLSGYRSIFLKRAAQGGPRSAAEVTSRGLSEALSAEDPEALLVTGYGFSLDRAALGWARSARRPVLFRAETTDHTRRRGFLTAALRDCALRWIYSGCRKLLYVGSRSKRHYLRLGCPEEKLVFSPYCIDPAPFRSAERERAVLRERTRAELGLDPEKKALLFSGKMSPRKDPEIVVKAVRLLPETLREKTVLLFMGAGELLERVKASAGVSPRVEAKFLGFRNQTELSPIYHAADLLILPSIQFESWGLVVNEALLHGLSGIVSEEVGCAPDLILPGRTGELFPAGSAAGLAEAICRGLQWVGTPESRQACREKVEQYNLQKAAQGIAEAYRAAESPGHGR